MTDFIGTLFMVLTGVFLGAIGMRVLWLMSLEEGEEE